MWNERQSRNDTSPFLPARVVLTALALVLVQPALQGCAPAVVAGIAVGASVVHERRDAGTVWEDEQIELQAMADFHNDPTLKKQARVSITSYNHVALLTGQARTEEVRQRAADKVSRLPKVRRVVNEISVGPFASLARESEDTLITSRVKFELTHIDLPGFDPTRVKVVTEAGVVYLMGLVSTEEAEASVEKARYVSGVQKVVKIFEYVVPQPHAA
jgi:osmotically-inducible protein OsmY